jgi:hypothetical protein
MENIGGRSMSTHLSDSAEQRTAEALICAAVAEKIRVALIPGLATLQSGAVVQVDGIGPDFSVLVEIFAHQGVLKGGQKQKVCKDALKLITLRRHYPHARLFLAFADTAAAAYATTGTWLSRALIEWGVEVVVVQLDAQDREKVLLAQTRQRR